MSMWSNGRLDRIERAVRDIAEAVGVLAATYEKLARDITNPPSARMLESVLSHVGQAHRDATGAVMDAARLAATLKIAEVRPDVAGALAGANAVPEVPDTLPHQRPERGLPTFDDQPTGSTSSIGETGFPEV